MYSLVVSRELAVYEVAGHHSFGLSIPCKIIGIFQQILTVQMNCAQCNYVFRTVHVKMVGRERAESVYG
jgi:hypothetical protein